MGNLPVTSEYKPRDPAGHLWLNLLGHICARGGHVIREYPRCRLEYSSCACGLRVG